MQVTDRADRRTLIGFDDRKLIFFSTPVFGFFYPLLVFQLSPLDELSIFTVSVFISMLHILGFWFVLKWLVISLRRKFPLTETYKKRLIYQSVILISGTFILTIISEFSQFCFGFHDYLQSTLFDVYIGNLIITIIIVSFYEGAYFFQLFKISLVKNEELKRKNSQAQLEVLRNQVNPHFLFNSLNTLVSVIPEDADTAVKFTEKLSSVYRYILEIREKELITLEEELKCIEAYQYLLLIRFGNHIQFEYTGLENGLNTCHIVPLSIQMLIENAIKHNVVSKNRPLVISITREEDQLIICNTLQPKTQHEHSTGVGLKNISKRYQLLVEKEITIQNDSTTFCVCLPLIKIREVD